MKKMVKLSVVGMLIGLGTLAFAATDTTTHGPNVYGKLKNTNLSPFISGELNGQWLAKHNESKSGSWEKENQISSFPIVLDTASFWFGAYGSSTMMNGDTDFSYGGKAQLAAYGGKGGRDPNHARIRRAQAWIGSSDTGFVHVGTQKNVRYAWSTQTKEAGQDSLTYYYQRGGRWFQFYTRSITSYEPGINYETPTFGGFKVGVGFYDKYSGTSVSGAGSTGGNNLGLVDNSILVDSLSNYGPTYRVDGKNISVHSAYYDPANAGNVNKLDTGYIYNAALNYANQFGDLALNVTGGLTYAKANDRTDFISDTEGNETRSLMNHYEYNDIMVWNTDVTFNYRGFVLAGEFFDNGKSGNLDKVSSRYDVTETTAAGKKKSVNGYASNTFGGNAGTGYNATVGYRIGKWYTALVFAQEFATSEYLNAPGYQTLDKSVGTVYSITGSYDIVPGVQTYVGLNLASTDFGNDNARENLYAKGKKLSYANTTDLMGVVGLDVQF